ncbi:ankyrin repeat containing protein [Colletotrichum truncatum]|uniref:Ankyrin repeat containing protein n=1 Tax=Colletotrichum truncatum TaxID=5467 RepID=A0ACC3YC44_COLTU
MVIAGLEEPQLQEALKAFLQSLELVWASLPASLANIIRSWFPLRLEVEKAVTVEDWVLARIHTISSDPATLLYNELSRFQGSGGKCLDRVKRDVSLVAFSQLQKQYRENHGTTLPNYLGQRLKTDVKTIRQNCSYWTRRGKILDTIATELGGYGALLLDLPIRHAGWYKKSRCSIDQITATCNKLRLKKLHRCDETEKYYDIADRLFKTFQHEYNAWIALQLPAKSELKDPNADGPPKWEQPPDQPQHQPQPLHPQPQVPRSQLPPQSPQLLPEILPLQPTQHQHQRSLQQLPQGSLQGVPQVQWQEQIMPPQQHLSQYLPQQQSSQLLQGFSPGQQQQQSLNLRQESSLIPLQGFRIIHEHQTTGQGK